MTEVATVDRNNTSEIIERLRLGGPNALAIAGEAADLIERLQALLKMALEDLEADEVLIDGEWGSCRSLAELEAAGELRESVLLIRAAIGQ